MCETFAFRCVSTLSMAAAVVVLAILSISAPPAFASGLIPAGVSAKLAADTNLGRLWSAPGSRLPVIIEFGMPALDAASFSSPADADAAQTRAIRAAQDSILDRLLGAPTEIASAEASAERSLKRMDFSPMFAFAATAAELERLAADSRVARIHEDTLSKPSLDQSVPLIGMPNAYSVGATGNGYMVAVLDTGARRTHEFLLNRVVRAACFSTISAAYVASSLCPGGSSSSVAINAADDCNEATIKDCGHGTFVSGIAAGFNTNRQSGEPANGVARDGRIISVNIYSRIARSNCGSIPAQYTGGCLKTFASDQIRGLEHVYGLRNTLKIAAVSLAFEGGIHTSSTCDSDSRKPIIDLLQSANIATIVSTGNSGFTSSVNYPACISSTVAIAASTKSDQKAAFSNWGSLVDFVAPGEDILAPFPNGGSNTGYTRGFGTSAAAAHVAGAWAALRSARPTATVTQIVNALENSGIYITVPGNVAKKRIRVDQAFLALNGITPGSPFNDNFAYRHTISGPGQVEGTNIYAGRETGEPIHANRPTADHSVWWRYTVRASGPVTIDTFGSAFDTVLGIYTGTAVNALTTVTFNDDAVPGSNLQSRVTFQGVAGTTYNIAVASFESGTSGSIRLRIHGGVAASIVAAVTPVARAAQVRSTVTAFATVINTSEFTATGCSVDGSGYLVTFGYRSRAANGALGPLNTPVNIAPRARQDFLLSFNPNSVATSNMQLIFDCTNSPSAPHGRGLNTFYLTATAALPADIIATAVTPTGDGIMNVPLGGTGVAALAAINIGSTATLQARLQPYMIGTVPSTLPGTLLICRTNPSNGQCLAPPTSPVLNFSSAAGQTATFTAFFRSSGPITFDPVNNRVFVLFYQGSTPVGATSVAIRTVIGGGAAVETASARR